MFTELLLGYWTNEKLICICSPTLVLSKGTNAHQRNVSSARLIVYTAHFIRAGLDFQDLVPILSVLGLPLDMVRARVKFWSGTDGAKSFTRLNLSVPNQFFWYAYFFHPSRAKNFLPCKCGFCYNCLGNLVHPGYRCHKCKGKHHTSLCSGKHSPRGTATAPIAPTVPNNTPQDTSKPSISSVHATLSPITDPTPAASFLISGDQNFTIENSHINSQYRAHLLWGKYCPVWRGKALIYHSCPGQSTRRTTIEEWIKFSLSHWCSYISRQTVTSCRYQCCNHSWGENSTTCPRGRHDSHAS